MRPTGTEQRSAGALQRTPLVSPMALTHHSHVAEREVLRMRQIAAVLLLLAPSTTLPADLRLWN